MISPHRFFHQPKSPCPKKGDTWATRAPKHKTSLTTIQAGVKQSANRMVAALSFSQHPFMTINTTGCPCVARQNVVLRRFLEASVGFGS